MADSTLTVVVNADTSNAQAGLDAVNQALGYTKIQANNTRNPVAELYGTMQSASDKAVAGMIKGTETWHQALLSILQDLEIKFAQLAVNRLLHDTVANALGLTSAQATNVAEVASNQEKNAAIAASNQAAATTGNPAGAATLVKQIGSDAAAAYAGVYANLSPVLGPAAAIPAGVAYASVAGMEGLVSLDVGAWNVPQNMPAYLHAGEMVVPANFASGLRDGGAATGGGDSYTININAIDTQTGAQFLKNNAGAIASVLSSQARNFNRNLPVWKS
jgi:hypothetical protein